VKKLAKKSFSKKNILLGLLGVLTLLSLFWFYSTYMQRYIGACDYYGYYQEALLLKSGKVIMNTGLDPRKYPCTAPLGYYTRNGRVVPQYTPGYPLLLALGSFLGADFYVNPLIGVLSVLMMFLLLLELTEKRIAILFSLLWAFSPIVAWGSTYLMSDLAAALFIMLGFYLFLREKPGAAAICLGFSVAVRPTNLFFILILLPLLIKKHQWLRFGLHLLIPASLYGAFNWIIYGVPWRFGYGNISYDLTHTVFFPHLVFYLKEIVVQFTPVLAILALFALVRKTRYSWFYGLWFLFFLIFYSFWRAGGDLWWWMRFLLPALPALFILAALGLKRILDTTEKKWRKLSHKTATLLITLVTIAMLMYFVQYGKKNDVYINNKGYDYAYLSNAVGKLVPPGSLVGAFEISGALRIYANVEPFNWHNFDVPDLIKESLGKNIPVYLVVERWNLQHYFINQVFEKFDVAVIKNTGVRENWLVEADNWLFKIIGPKDRTDKKGQ
jgi:hypothetical protein